MDYLIPVVNKLQDVFGAIGHQAIDLPQIVVCGSQSVGKSSVLENIVGRDFLPRGLGIVTRRPLILQLYCVNNRGQVQDSSITGIEDANAASFPPTPPSSSASNASPGVDAENMSPNTNRSNVTPDSSSSTQKLGSSSRASRGNNGEEWGEFLHLPGQRFFDFSEIRAEIQRETERISGKNKGISNKSINLKIFSPHVLNLTLVDLPGITKVPTGDQPEDVEEQIRSMCHEFIVNPNAIILAVTAANQDLVNSDGLKMARSVDPDGERTIGVLTKVDIMDQGTDCVEILSNRVVPLRRGYIAVCNRSQKDIMEARPIRDGLAKEQMYFMKHAKYRNMLSKCGTQNLARMLNQILMLHIRDCLPDIKSKIMGMMGTVQANIDALGEPTDDLGGAALGATLLQLLSKFARCFANSVEGRGSSDGTVEMSELCGGARISHIFNEIFGRSLKQLSPFEGLDDEDIRTAIANANGPRPSLFVPEIAFDLLVKKQIEKLLQPGLQCVDLVFDEMQRMAFQSENPELARFPELRDRMFEIVQHQLRQLVGPTQKMICNLINIELAYINTSHPDFIGGKQAVAQLNKRFQQQQHQAQQQQAQQASVESSPDKENSDEESHALPHWANSNGGAQSEGANKGFFSLFKNTQNNKMSEAAFLAQKGVSGNGVNRNSSTPDSNFLRLPHVPDKMRSNGNGHPTDRERVETEIIKALMQSYFDIVKKNFTDMVPKTIMHFLVNTFKENLQNELVRELYRENIMTELMRETEDVATRRKTCREMKDLLRRGLEIVNEVRDFNTFK